MDFSYNALTEEVQEINPDHSFEMEEIRSAIGDGDLCKATEILNKYLEEIENAPLDIAITGESGTGKSTFVNAIRGMDDEEEGSAATGVVETTMEPIPYTHQHYTNVTFWDLPGIGTPNFVAADYLQSVKFSRYDFFIIISSERFKQNDIDLAKEIQVMDKKFYFVRSKVDNDLDASQKRRKKTYNEEKILKEIRDDCIKKLNGGGIAKPQVFLLSCLDLDKYDFHEMQETLEKELPKHKRHIFLISLPNISLPILKKKRETLKKYIWMWSTLSCAVAAAPIPGLSVVVDIGILIKAMKDYRSAFGLDEKSLKKLADKFGKDVGKKQKMDYIITDEEVQEIRSALEGGDLCKATERFNESIKELKNAPLDIAITGESGTGKSTFVNAIRGMDDEDDGSAATGVVETTMEPMPYTHQHYTNVTFWDLPGIGTPNFVAADYLQSVKFSRYDFFIIISSERFKQNDIDLAKEIQAMDKKFYFVRSKVDCDLRSSKVRRKKTYNEEAILKEIRDNCIQNLNDGGITEPNVFLLSYLDLDKYDFRKMQDTLEKELPEHKRHIFLISLPNISLPILEKKREALKKDIWRWSVVSWVVATIATPKQSIACDVGILVKVMKSYQKTFGLDKQSLEKLANKCGKDVSELRSVIKSPVVVEELVIKLLTGGPTGSLRKVQYVAGYIPLLGGMVAGGISFGSIYWMLCNFLKDIAEDAVRVLEKALETPA